MNSVIKNIANIPFVWNTLQDIIGANQWKSKMYPSVFEKKSGTLLDFGCSSGNETEMFLDFDYYGIDVDAQAIDGAKKKFAKYPNVHFECLNIINGRYKKDFFDHVLFAGTGHHLTDAEFKNVLPVLFENLKPGGKLHFFDLVRQPGKDSWLTRLIISMDQGKNPRTIETYKRMFDEQGYQTSTTKMFPNPYKIIKFPDFLYLCVTK